jgi:ribosomal protein L44E
MSVARDTLKELDKEKHIEESNKYKVDIEDLPDGRWTKRAIRKQEGGEYHGKLVVKGIELLTKKLDLYGSCKECFDSVTLENSFAGAIPDILDKENKVLVECGFNKGYDDQYYFLLKVLQYMDNLIEADGKPTEWTFMHIPKSVKGNKVAYSVSFNSELIEEMKEKQKEFLEDFQL